MNDLLNQENNSKNIIVTHGLILLSYLETFCNFKFDGQKFNIQYKDKIIIDGNPKSPSVYKIIYNDNNEIIDVNILECLYELYINYKKNLILIIYNSK